MRPCILQKWRVWTASWSPAGTAATWAWPPALATRCRRQGLNAGQLLPEVIGFNLGYEQLPLHLLITACERNELGLDPYYFTLHITVDHADTGHAQRAVQAVFDTLPQWGGHGDFWQRVCNGGKLGSAGVGTTEAIRGFDIGRELLSV